MAGDEKQMELRAWFSRHLGGFHHGSWTGVLGGQAAPLSSAWGPSDPWPEFFLHHMAGVR